MNEQRRTLSGDGFTLGWRRYLPFETLSGGVIRKGKGAKPNEFGKMVKLQEAENQIVIGYEVYDRPESLVWRQSSSAIRRSSIPAPNPSAHLT